jgi:hypothetical protein
MFFRERDVPVSLNYVELGCEGVVLCHSTRGTIPPAGGTANEIWVRERFEMGVAVDPAQAQPAALTTEAGAQKRG